MGFADAVRSCLSQYATFSGRARRSEYWWWTLFNVLVSFGGVIVLAVLIGIGGGLSTGEVGGGGGDGGEGATALAGIGVLLLGVVYLALLLPSLAVFARRMHDTGRSGWWFLLGLIPFGGIVLLFFSVLDSQGDNQYGPSPKYPGQVGPGGYGAGYAQPYPQQYGGQPGYGQQPPQYGQPPEYGTPQPPYGQPPQDNGR